MKPYQKLLLAFAVIVLCACVLSPVVKPLADTLVPKSTKLMKKLNYDKDSKTYDFGKVFRRLLMLSALVVLIAARKMLDIGSAAALGFRRTIGWLRNLVTGVLIGVLSMSVFVVILYLLGAALWKGETDLARLLPHFGIVLLQAALIGIIEETIFRGFVLQTLLKDMRFLFAAVFSSAVYSLLHFFKADVPVTMGADALVGFRSLSICFAPLVSDPAIAPGFLGLFLLGMVFAYSYRWTQSLYLPIALHASWVFALKVSGSLLYLDVARERWLYGSKQIVDGLLGCVFLVAVFALLGFLFARQTREAQAEQ